MNTKIEKITQEALAGYWLDNYDWSDFALHVGKWNPQRNKKQGYKRHDWYPLPHYFGMQGGKIIVAELLELPGFTNKTYLYKVGLSKYSKNLHLLETWCDYAKNDNLHLWQPGDKLDVKETFESQKLYEFVATDYVDILSLVKNQRFIF